jgi:5-amino-6-(5-phosphoribosylamino)uracil reductase
VLAVSLDGRLAPASGGAAQLGGAGDRRVLEEALAWADACLIGGHTLRLHGTTCQIRAADLLQQRHQQGRPPQPMALVVSRGSSFDRGLRFFQQPLRRGLLAPPAALVGDAAPAGFDAAWPLTSWPATLMALAAAGLHRLVVLGGAQLAASLLEQDLVQELQLTLCPQLLGGPHGWLPADAVLQPSSWSLQEQRQLEGEELLLRYGRFNGAEPSADPA